MRSLVGQGNRFDMLTLRQKLTPASYETRAECRLLKGFGADAVGEGQQADAEGDGDEEDLGPAGEFLGGCGGRGLEEGGERGPAAGSAGFGLAVLRSWCGFGRVRHHPPEEHRHETARSTAASGT